MPQISLADLNAASRADFVAALANVVEYSPWIAEQLAAQLLGGQQQGVLV